MAFDWSDYLRLADELAADGKDPASTEARLRSSVSRAYFAVFCKARNCLRDIEGRYFSRGAKVHMEVCDSLNDYPNAPRAKIASLLEKLRDRRNDADYEDHVQGLPLMASISITEAREAFTALGNLFGP